MSDRISDTGVSVAYEPENSQPIVDIVFVHGLQGHPLKTWTYRPKTLDTIKSSPPSSDKKEKKSVISRIATHLRRRSSNIIPASDVELVSAALPKSNNAQLAPVFWPADLLPKECPSSRILVFGYDSKITKYAAGAINQNSIFSHGKDLLFALRRERSSVKNRPLVFVAHSLGGIVVKEMLVRSSSTFEDDLRSIVESTAAVVFLGTPHRGSQDVAALGEVVRSVISSFGMETTAVNLNALGLKTTDLERAQEDFSKLWLKYDFQVKTFQEGLSLPKLGKKVVPDYSSLIGDHREHAETLQANHIEMCRYSGPGDPNYCKVAGELHCIYQSILRVKAATAPPDQAIQRGPTAVPSVPSSKERPHNVNCNQVNEACLGSLWFPAINNRYQTLERPADQTCSWLFTHELYHDWFSSRSRQESYGLLWLKGKPGAGKSTLMKEAFRRTALEQVESNYRTAAFFFNAKGDDLEHSRLGLFRSLLYQLLPRDKQWLQRFHNIWYDEEKFQRSGMGQEAFTWAEGELRTFFESMLTQQTKKRTFLFIDALDECDEPNIRSTAYFWREITKTAYERGVDLNVCLSSRHFPTVSLSDCPEIIVEQHNYDDIATYVDYKFQICMSTQKPQWELLMKNILNKSAGIFLWVVLVVEDVLKSKDEGHGMPYLIKRVEDVPEELETLFSNMISNLEPHAKELTAKFFQWAILATKPLRLHEWHHIMAFIRQPTLKSLREWRQSDNFTENDEQLEKQIRRISKGLVEVKQVRAGEQEEAIDVTSILAGAGSLDLEHGDTRIVQIIHESVRSFFLTNNGFSMLDPSLQSNPIGSGHLSIMVTCLDYINIHELDALVEARIHAIKPGLGSRRITTPIGRDVEYRTERLRSLVFSSRNDHARYGNFMSDREHRSKILKDMKNTFFETLRSLDCTPAVDIDKWMNSTISARRTSLEGSPCESTAHSCDMSRSQILEDYPALLSYATAKLFTHASLADKTGVDMGPFIKRLEEGVTWTRWSTLKEDIPKGTAIRSYFAEMGLSSQNYDSGVFDWRFAANLRRRGSSPDPAESIPPNDITRYSLGSRLPRDANLFTERRLSLPSLVSPINHEVEKRLRSRQSTFSPATRRHSTDSSLNALPNLFSSPPRQIGMKHYMPKAACSM